MSTARRHDIDWLRVIAIGLLLIYHIAILFQPWAMFIGFIRSEELLEDLWKPMTLLNIWRIPLLFFVSGMGFYFAMRKRNWKQLLLERTKRILTSFFIRNCGHNPIAYVCFSKTLQHALSIFSASRAPMVLAEYFHLCSLAYASFYLFKE